MSVLNKDKFIFKLESDIIPRLKSAGFERNRYNIFDILRLNRKELKHSDFLAFLFSPNQSGEIGNQFLKLFLSLLAHDKNNKINIDPVTIFHSKFENVLVRREYKNIDLLIEAITSKEKIVIVIENKVGSGERVGNNENEGQLPTYRDIVNTEYNAQANKIFLFLTPDKTLPEKDKDWIPIDYKFIFSVLCKLNLDNADSTVQILVNDYRKMIRSEFDMPINETEQRIVNKIYSDYKDVFEYINKHKPDRINISADIVRKYIITNCKIVLDKAKSLVSIVFRTKELADIKSIYFQLNIDDMTLYCYVDGASDKEREVLGNDKGSKTFRFGGGKQWLFGDKKKTDEVLKKHDELLLKNNLEQLKAEIEDKLKAALKPDGFVFTQSAEICRLLRGDK